MPPSTRDARRGLCAVQVADCLPVLLCDAGRHAW
ncbi:MAG: hypothetical protein KatS3mg123_2228 [Burkholderiales bacterium]|nr:MAG: hypothetical protein KatS3mg123_2228 [Burkholderiales bacterium]